MVVHGNAGRTRPAQARWARTPLHAACAGLGPVMGAIVAVYLYDRGWTLPGVLVAFAVVAGVVALGLPDAVFGPRRVVRVAFGLLPLAISVAGFLLAARWWDPSWLALLVGGVAGSAVGSGLQPALFPGLARERDVRWRGTEGTGYVAGSDDWIPGWRDLALLVAMGITLVGFLVAGLPGYAYVIAVVVFAVLFLVSAVAGWRRRQPDRDAWRREALGGAWRRAARPRRR